MNKHEDEHIEVIHAITEALFSLMETKPFSEITVTELIKKAGVARSTYYRNFSAKEDIVKLFFKQIFFDFLKRYPTATIEDRYSPEYVEHILEYLPPFKRKIQILNSAGVSSFYLTMLNELLMELYKKPIMTPEDSYRIYSIAGAEYNLIFNWYLQERHGNTDGLKRYLSDKNHFPALQKK